MWKKLKNFILDIFFPKFCFGCKKEGDYLCPDCKSILEISGFHQKFQTKHLSDLYFSTEYKNPLIKNLITSFKYEPFVKELAKDLSFLIIDHFQLLDKKLDFLISPLDYLIVPVPLEKKRLKWRGFNQAEEIAKELGNFLNIQVFNVLIKTKSTPPQVELSEKERKESLKGAFFCQNPKLIENKKILLIDDVYTTGSTMEESARVLKEAGAKEIVGIVIARATPGQDK